MNCLQLQVTEIGDTFDKLLIATTCLDTDSIELIIDLHALNKFRCSSHCNFAINF